MWNNTRYKGTPYGFSPESDTHQGVGRIDDGGATHVGVAARNSQNAGKSGHISDGTPTAQSPGAC